MPVPRRAGSEAHRCRANPGERLGISEAERPTSTITVVRLPPATGRTDPVRERAAPRGWPTLCGDTVHVPEVSEALLERVRRVYSSQAADEVRFGQAAPDLFARLDSSVGVLVAMTCDHWFARLFENWAASCVWHGTDVRSSTIVFPTDRQAQERIERLGFLTYFDQDSELLFGMRESGAYGDLA